MNSTANATTPTTNCDHIKDAFDNSNQPTGSWADELVLDTEIGRRHRLACKFCGKLYGYFVRTMRERRAVTSPSYFLDKLTHLGK